MRTRRLGGAAALVAATLVMTSCSFFRPAPAPERDDGLAEITGPDVAAALRLADGALLLGGSTDRLRQDGEVVQSSAAIWVRPERGDPDLVLRERAPAGVRAGVTAFVAAGPNVTIAAGPGTAAPSVWTSVDTGRTWTLRDVAPTPGAAEQRVTAGVQVGTTTLLAGTSATTVGGPTTAAVWRSTDDGATWSVVPLDPVVAAAPGTSTQVESAAVVGDTVLIVGSRRPQRDGPVGADRDDGVVPFTVTSGDAGRTWQPSEFAGAGPGADPTTDGIGLTAVVGVPLPPAPGAPPDAPLRFTPVVGGRTAQPEPGGAVWRPAPPDGWTPTTPWSLAQRLDGDGDDAVVRALLRLDDGTLLAMQADGTVWASRDNGAKWGLRRSGVGRCPVTLVPVAGTDFRVVGCDAATG